MNPSEGQNSPHVIQLLLIPKRTGCKACVYWYGQTQNLTENVVTVSTMSYIVGYLLKKMTSTSAIRALKPAICMFSKFLQIVYGYELRANHKRVKKHKHQNGDSLPGWRTLDLFQYSPPFFLLLICFVHLLITYCLWQGQYREDVKDVICIQITVKLQALRILLLHFHKKTNNDFPNVIEFLV